MLRRVSPFLSLLLVLAACAPTGEEGPSVAVQQLTEPISFYPQQTGAVWQYLPDGAQLSEPRLFSMVEGPAVLDGEVVIGWRRVGRGIDEVNFRTYGPAGVHLIRSVKPGSIIDFEPPVHELPAQADLRVGATWAGETVATVTYPEARTENRVSTLDISYRYTVVDRRPATVPAGTFDVFVIDFTSSALDEEGTETERLSQTFWYSPNVGEVRTVNGYYLVETNFLGRTGSGEGE